MTSRFPSVDDSGLNEPDLVGKFGSVKYLAQSKRGYRGKGDALACSKLVILISNELRFPMVGLIGCF
jgi:hypothetical protein